MTEMEITNKEIADYYKGKDVAEADKLLMKTAQNNFIKGYEEYKEKLIKIIKDFKGEQYTDLEIWKEMRKDLLKELKK